MLLSAGSALASCGPIVTDDGEQLFPGDPNFPSSALDLGESVFVGRVVGLTDSDRTATFAVDEVWRGPDLPASVVVHGSGADLFGFSSVDRTWEAGVTYLVFAEVDGNQLSSTACNLTQPWSEGLTAVRPSDARPPSDAADVGSGGIPIAWLVAIGAAAGVVIISVVAFRRAR